MKSIFLLCEYGVPLTTVNNLYENNITIEKILNDNSCLDFFMDSNGAKKKEIIESTQKINNGNKYNSLYELVEFGLSKTMVEKLIAMGMCLEDINETAIRKHKIGNATSKKIFYAFHKYLKEKNIKIELEIEDIYFQIKNHFGHNVFKMEDLNNFFCCNNYSTNNLESAINKLSNDNKIMLNKNGFYVPYNIYDLEKYGLSKTIINFLEENNIKLGDINETMQKDFCISNGKYRKILDAYNMLAEEYDFHVELTEGMLLKLIEKNFGYNKFSFDELKNVLENNSYCVDKLEQYLLLLKNSEKISYDNGLFCVAYPKLIDELNKISNKNNHLDIVFKRLSGLTLEQVGNEYGVTRERIRQIFSKEFKKIPVVEEDKYSSYITKYNFNCELFCELFNEKEYVYYYLKEKYKIGDIEVSELINNSQFTEEQIEIIRKKYNLIRFNDENIVASKNSILVAYLKSKERQVDYTELMNGYNEIITTNNLELELLTKQDFRKIDSILGRSNYILNTLGKSYRYYNCMDIDEEDKKELEDLLDVEPGVYSSELFFKDNPLLMKKLDILDEYELHNLLRKVLEPKDDIVYSRMPDIYIKCEDKYKFIESLIQELSPVNIDEFADFVYQSYGHKIPSFKSYLQNNFNHYININTLISDCPIFDNEQFEFMKKYLKEDIYSTITIKKLLTDEFDVQDFKLLNSLNFSRLGYKIRGNYIMKSSINNFESYMRDLINSVDFYKVPAEMKKIGSTFSSYLYKFICDKKIFKYTENTYITIKKLKSMGIYEDDIDDFIEKISNMINENEYFNLYVLNTDFESNLFDFKLPDCFYETLIMIIPNVKTFRLKNNTIFIKTNETATREKFINSFIVKDKTYVSEIKTQIKNLFNIELHESYIKEFINKNKYYLQNSIDCVYLSKEVYENEVNQWNILQYID